MKFKAWLHDITAPKSPAPLTAADWWSQRLDMESQVSAVAMLTPHIEHAAGGVCIQVLQDSEEAQTGLNKLVNICDAQWAGKPPSFPGVLESIDQQMNENQDAFDTWVRIYSGKKMSDTDVLWGRALAKRLAKSRLTLAQEKKPQAAPELAF